LGLDDHTKKGIVTTMARPWRITYSGAVYHVTSRGNGRQSVFLQSDDYRRFTDQLQHALDEDEVILYAYVLMPNHYHLLIETPLGNVKRFMQRLNTAYAMYFRYKHTRPGHCFQGRYGAKLVGGDEYIIRITRYIHLNPVSGKRPDQWKAAERLNRLNTFPWSSYGGYIRKDDAEPYVDYRWLKLMQRRTLKGNRAAYRKYAESMIAKDDDALRDELEASPYAIGDEAFVEETEYALRQMRMQRAVTGDILWPQEMMLDIHTVESATAESFGVGVADLRGKARRASTAKSVAIELSCRLTGKSQREVSRHFGYASEATISKQRKRLARAMGVDGELERRVARLKHRLMRGEPRKS